MVTLDYRLSPLWHSIAAPAVKFAALTEFELEGEVFFGEAIILINGHDLSWHVDLPLIDFARNLFMAVTELSPLEPEAHVRTLDYNERIYLFLDERSVIIRPTYSAEEATCALPELTAAAAAFGLRVHGDFVSAYPESKQSGILKEWYPLMDMKRIAKTA